MSNEQYQLIEDCEARDSRLGDWDRNFLDSVKRQLESGRPLTQKQSDTLEAIWERATAKG
jgi:hypothetical protein